MAIPREADSALRHSGAGEVFGDLGQDALRNGGQKSSDRYSGLDYSNTAVKKFRAAESAGIIFIERQSCSSDCSPLTSTYTGRKEPGIEACGTTRPSRCEKAPHSKC